MIVTWRELLKDSLQRHGENWDDVLSTTLTDEQADVKFCDEATDHVGGQ